MLPIHSYRLDTASSARLVNCFAEATPPGAKGPVILRRAPGIAPQTACGTGPGRGLHVMKGELYAVSGTKLYLVPQAGAVRELGVIAGSGRVSMADNGVQLAIISSSLGYVYSGGLVQITDPDFTARNPSSPRFSDNYLMLIDAGTGQFFISDLADFTSYDGLQFATAEGAPDNLIALEVDHRDAFLVGTSSCELWQNQGGAGFPYERLPNGFIEIGGIAPLGICKQDNSPFWLASDKTFRRLQGGTPLKVSQIGVERAWGKYSRVDDAECYPYTLEGHLAVVIRFPTAQATWIYDCSTQEWHERDGYLSGAWDISGIVECYGRVYVQRASTGEVGILDSRTFKDWEQPLRAQWAYQPLYSKGNDIQINRVRMGIEVGVGIPTAAEASGDGTDPRITLELSRKGGREGTFKVVGSRSLGRQGDFKRAVHWDGLGTGPDNVLRATFSDPNPLTIWSTEVDAVELAT